jgi:LTXXQ motif family protein
MNRTVMSAAALAIIGAGAFAFAQTQTPQAPAAGTPAAPATSGAPTTSPPAIPGAAGMRASAEDRAVLLDARIGAIKAALRLTPDQEKLWEPVEAFIRKAAALRDQRIEEMRERMAQFREGMAPAFDPIARLRARADRVAMRATLMREFADAAAPLYASLSDDQKRRAFFLIRHGRGAMGMGMMHGPAMGRGGMGDGMGRDGMGRGGMGDGMGRGGMRGMRGFGGRGQDGMDDDSSPGFMRPRGGMNWRG